MVRIAITQAAFDAIVTTMPLACGTRSTSKRLDNKTITVTPRLR